MALVQALPVPTDHPKPSTDVQQCCSVSHSPTVDVTGTMGSVSSLISGRTYQERHCRAASDFGARYRKPTPATSCFRQQEGTLRSSSSQEQLLNSQPPLPAKNKSSALISAGNGNYGYLSDEPVGDWNDNHVSTCSPSSDTEEPSDNRGMNGNIGGPPPKLVPVSGRLEKSMEKILIRPTAFKPVLPKNRNSVQYLSPRSGGSLSESQGSLNLLLPGTGAGSGCQEKRNSYSGGRNARSSQSCTMSDSGRNSLSSLPTYSSTGYSLTQSEVPNGHMETTRSGVGHGHSNSDSGRSSSSKSTGSLSGRGQPLSDSGSCGRSPAPGEGYEGVIRELEEKLRERDLELQQLRDNLDENEAAICQVYEEKQKRCEQEMEDLRQSCASKMKQVQLKAQRAQQVLQLQVFQLQQEKKKLQEDFSQLLQEREALEKRCASFEREQTQFGPRLEETKWEVCQKSGEISLLKQQLKDVQADLGQKASEIVALKAQLREARSELQASQARSQEAHATARTRTLELEVCENELQRRKSEAELLREKMGRLEEESLRLKEAMAVPTPQTLPSKGQSMSLPLPQSRGGIGHGISPAFRDNSSEEQLLAYESDEAKAQRQSVDVLHGLRQQVDRLRAELMYERRRSEDQLEGFEDERRVWQEEKDKVIRYQKQLQQNYIQMYRRNRDLERVMRELSLELENRDMEEFDMRSNEIHFEEITATEI
ncbi:leucine zipper putative tumor suppressor 2a isoform X1 [Danio rerio]|uniref:Leucine zipper putative tumor suppressor 2 homolog n=2 Tax=Danio rerio TaxID=7955 RepID=A0A8M3AZ07_DANRE|nr:leucine zipper, putative tumor suppressor 2a isoform X1 [Danio rerio]XP_009305533.1 leucine zipper, putative tumor suppressor 2a isoform X1 [Danio rerio]|eukprot:XP_005156744.1 leucine zipper, putative tumor suppressor 2a isoform X1 [Danio rerio]